MTESKQNETVERFRNGFYKVLVATSVGSEGIDVPDCNIVLSYNNTGNEIQKIQMSGRYDFCAVNFHDYLHYCSKDK